MPSVFTELASLPLTANGKVDRAALPAPDGARPELGGEYVAPSTPAEELLAGIWAQVLGVERVGATDSFFELGGHSLLATQVIARAREAFATEIPLSALFDRPTVRELAQVIEDRIVAEVEQMSEADVLRALGGYTTDPESGGDGAAR